MSDIAELRERIRRADADSERSIKQMGFWRESQRAAPNAFLRSALFAGVPGRERSDERNKDLTINAQSDYQILYTGFQLTQAELDVWEELLHRARTQPLGNKVMFSAGSFLKAIGRSQGKSQYDWLKRVTDLLMSGYVKVVDVKTKRTVATHLVQKFHRDDNTNMYAVELDPSLLPLFDGGFTKLDWEERKQLKRKPLALWLHAYYSSHRQPYPVKVETLKELSGSRAVTRNFKYRLRKALDCLLDIGFLISWDLKDGKVTVTKSSEKHLLK